MKRLPAKAPLWALAIALGLASCQGLEHKTALEGRVERIETDEDEYSDADVPIGGSLVVMSMPIQGASNKFGWEAGYGAGSDSFDLSSGEYELQSQDAWLGVRYAMSDGHWRPYLSAGVQWTQHEVNLEFLGVETKRATDDIGPYVEAGLQLRFNRSLHMSLGYRETIGLEGHLPPLEVDLDTSRAFLGIGVSF